MPETFMSILDNAFILFFVLNPQGVKFKNGCVELEIKLKGEEDTLNAIFQDKIGCIQTFDEVDVAQYAEH